MKKSIIARAVDRFSAAFSTLFREKATASGCFSWQFLDANGVPVPGSGGVANLIVATGRRYIAERCATNDTATANWIAVGGNAAAPASGQTALLNELSRVALTSRVASAAGVMTCVATFPSGTTLLGIEEIGLFNAATGGLMVCRATTGTISKPSNLGLQITWDLTIASA